MPPPVAAEQTPLLQQAPGPSDETAPTSRVGPRSRFHFDPRHLVLLIVFVVASAFYAWTAATAGTRSQFVGYPDDYVQLSEGFLHGELSIPTPAPKSLLALPDPYVPRYSVYRGPFGDLALYHGHLYVDWGPTPVLTLYLPWHLLGLGWPSGNFAVWIYTTIGLAFALATLGRLVRHFLPDVSSCWVALAGLAVAISTALPFINREPDNYEVAVACAYCFSMIGVFLFIDSLLREKAHALELVAASACLGLAVAARQDLFLLALGLVPAYLYLSRARKLSRIGERVRLATYLAGPLALVIALIGLYNFARFGNPMEIGSSYQLAGFDPRTTPYYQTGYLLPGLYMYLVSPIHFGLNFPFFYIPPPVPPFGAPLTWQPQIIVGIVNAAPIVLMLIAAPFAIVRRLDPLLRGILLTLVVTGLATVLVIAWSIPGGSERYSVDFSTLVVLPACICWLAWNPRRRVGRVIVRSVGTLLIALGVVIGLAISYTGYYNQITATQPALAAKLNSSTAWVGPFITRVLGHPVVNSVSSQAGAVTRVQWDSYGIGTILYMNISGQPTQFSMVNANRSRWSLTASFGPGPQYAQAGDSKIFLVIDDATGRHRYPYVFGTETYPVTVASGRSTVSISVQVRGRRLPATSSILASSGMTFHGPVVPTAEGVGSQDRR